MCSTMWKLVIFLCLSSNSLSFNIHKGIHIRAAGDLSTADLLKIDNYLRKYGYLIDQMPETQILATEEDRKYALQFFQNFNKLDNTGIYDDDTAALFAKDRCGCPDVMPIKNDEEWSKKVNPPKPVEFNLGTKWERNRLTWRLNSFSNKISNRNVRVETRRAFDLWSKNADLQFTEQSGEVDILIDFATRNHGDGNQNAFDGQGRVLAHAFFPPFGDTHFDDDENWVVNRTGTDYFTVAAHEFGHALGLGHSEINAALMAPFYSGYQPNRGLHPDDIAGIQALYGAPVTQTPPPVTTPRTTVRPPRPTRAPVIPPTDSPLDRERPYYCTTGFNAIIKDFNGEYLAFIGRSYLIRMNSDGLVGIYRQSARFGRYAIRRPDAAFQVNSGSLIMVLRGRRLARFDRWRRRVGSAWVSGGGSTMPEQTRAAIAFSSNDVSVFGYSQVWKMNPNTGEVVSGSHRYISDEFSGVPNGIDAAVIKDSRTIMFFKGQTVYNYNRTTRRVESMGDKGEAMMPNTCSLS